MILEPRERSSRSGTRSEARWSAIMFAMSAARRIGERELGAQRARHLIARNAGVLRGARIPARPLPGAYYEGIFAYLLDALRSVDAEGRRLGAWPAVSVSAPMDTSSVIAATYYVFWAVTIVPGIVCFRAWAGRRSLARKDMAFGVGLIVMTLVVNHVFLRANLPARFGDAVVPVVVLVAWAAGIAAAASSSLPRVLFARSAAALLLAALCAAFFQINDVAHELETGRFTESRHAAVVHFHEVADELRNQPPSPGTSRATITRSARSCQAGVR